MDLRPWLEREAFAMDHLLDYSVEFLHVALNRHADHVATAPQVVGGPAAGSTLDAPPDGWTRSTRTTFVAVAGD
jgi:hypothetical protein